MIRIENSFNLGRNIGPYRLNSPFINTGYRQSQINHLSTAAQSINENWSGYGVLPSIGTSGNQNPANRDIKNRQSDREIANLTKVTSYSQLRAQWLTVRNSKSIPQTTKDQIHEIYLDETTNQLNRLVFGDQDNNAISVGPTEICQLSCGNVDSAQRPGIVPKPPAYPRSRSTRRYRRMTKTRPDSTHVTALNPVMEFMTPRKE